MSYSPSSSSIPSPPTKSSLPELPIELLRQIIEYSVPSYYHTLTYQTRQLTLRDLCLTSQLFRQIAQPILERIEHLRLSHEGGRAEQNISVRSSRAHVLAVSLEAGMPSERINQFLLSYAHLKELHITSGYDADQNIDVSLLAALPCLESLTIHNTRLVFITSCPLLALKHFTLSKCYGNLDVLFTQPSYFPSLKVLALLDTEQLYSNTIDNTGFISRLDLFIGKPGSLKEEVLKAHADNVLNAYPYDDDISTFPRHLNIPHFRLRVNHVDLEFAGQVGDLYEALNAIRGFINFSSTSFKTLFLDQGLRDVLEPFRFTKAAYDALIERCEECGTEVILEEQAVIDSADSAITPELLRWMDRRKEEARL